MQNKVDLKGGIKETQTPNTGLTEKLQVEWKICDLKKFIFSHIKFLPWKHFIKTNMAIMNVFDAAKFRFGVVFCFFTKRVTSFIGCIILSKEFCLKVGSLDVF